MATKSMIKNINIKDTYHSGKLVDALEKAAKYRRKDSNTDFKCEEITKDKLKDIFG